MTKTSAIITVYQPPASFSALIERLRPQVEEIIIVNNGENPPQQGCHWIDNPDNGIAKAQNLGIAKARELGSTHILLMDDDSLPAKNMVATMLSVYYKNKRNKAKKPIGVIGPYIKERGSDLPPKYIQAEGTYAYNRVNFYEEETMIRDLFYVAASGSLIAMEVLDEIGEMREDFFIYFVDTEFCLRARKAGYDIIALRNAELEHSFGERSEHQFLGKTISTTNHNAQARYYMFRNRKALWKKYATSNAGYVIFDILRTQSELLRVALFEKNKFTKLKAMIKGLLG